MAWVNLPTNYTDAIFTGLRRYIPVQNDDGTISFQDVTVYENKENSFFGAKDANQINDVVNQIVKTVSTSPSMALAEMTLSQSAWVNEGDYYTQRVSIEGVEVNERIDVQPSASVLMRLLDDGVIALFVENNEGVLTAYCIGGVPTTDVTVQITKFGVPMN